MGVKDSFLGKLLGSADRFSSEQVSQTISLLIEHGVKHHASDIHIEPHERFALVRYRIDGALKGVHKLPIASLPAVAQQLKALTHLHVDDDQVPQEGQYSCLVGEDQFEVQVNTLPVLGGEKIVLHLSRRLNKPLSLESLGFWGPNLTLVRETLTRPHGLILVATPRRNGKTTTLHSMLQLLNTPAVSIATIETEIEYRLPGASQTKVKPQRGITFYEGLQAALNQDPNVVMLSSIPDKKTANTSIEAASGGHLVLGGLHADDACNALSHVRAMTDEPYLLAACLKSVISQRLVRKLCTHCRERYIPSHAQVAEIEKAFGITSASNKRKVHELEQRASREGIDSNSFANTTPGRITSLWRANDEGCEKCGHTGYQGVIAIVEALEVTPALQKLILEHRPANDMLQAALKEGFMPAGLDGLVKALRGQTTIAEILRTNVV
ncbi:MAG TPA: ATPase, T2SS/T4P/T4SS family [Candidatus Saccharimonadales bacterium]|nr:ATPase, T2SS/T4P/T4SS family [Candidatus Saccharimonadales bacterium]